MDHLACLNSTQAAIRAGYSEKTANEQAARLLTNVNVQNRIGELKAEQEQRYPRLLEPDKT
ncbi:terminase small subunit [Edwardsiella tarda]